VVVGICTHMLVVMETCSSMEEESRLVVVETYTHKLVVVGLVIVWGMRVDWWWRRLVEVSRWWWGL
jgi:hypothetical protein